ncbi:TetR/AcrR family transcriptional regulator [Amycolatopsis aidingensis]|uniref:TetR/AcrR family transcriptional regulator n=1 Tax=Amycolatopsis aidingensis TaxID=2842453 RepID=UPI001C0B9A06|nr:TetR/AcrR family transcriptional regulator [Amycolatopsis aidingensis]
MTGTPAAADHTDGSVRGRVLRAATTLFAQKGFENTSVREIVDTAGVTKGGLYHYFGSKDDLLHEIYTTMLRMQTRRMETIAASDLPLPHRLHAIVVDVVATSVSHLDEAVVFFQSMHLLEPAKLAKVRAERRHYHEQVRALVEQGQRAGTFRADVPADLVVSHTFGAVHRLGLWYRKDGPLTGEQVGHHYANLMIAGLLGDFAL